MLSVRRVLLFVLLSAPLAVPAADVRVAVASNFAPTLKRLAADFTAQTGHRVLISSGSTGKHYAQIRNGARFDLFMAADSERPALLEREGIGVAGSRFVYAEGRLVLWAPAAASLANPRDLLASGTLTRLAIANPRLAPYGLAARELLSGWGLWQGLQGRLVRGENVGQAFQFVATGNAPAGLVALSQVLEHDASARGAYQVIEAGLHPPIRQQALLLHRSPAAEALVRFLKGAPALATIRTAGYAVPGDA
jgi:molybdate transport system substrate-binding protein